MELTEAMARLRTLANHTGGAAALQACRGRSEVVLQVAWFDAQAQQVAVFILDQALLAPGQNERLENCLQAADEIVRKTVAMHGRSS